MRETIFEGIYDAFIQRQRQKALTAKPCAIDEIIEIMKMMQKYELDCHCVIAGQNGVGKSYILLAMLKAACGDGFLSSMIYADKTSDDLVTFMLENRNVFCGIDEMNLYFNYKKHAEEDQVHLINMLELAREHSIGFIGNARDPRKLTYNYRNGKMSIVIWVLDRFTDGGSYAAVFIANPSIESSDRFGFSALGGALGSFSEVRQVFENDVPSFVNWLDMKHIRKYVSAEQVKEYRVQKDIAMAEAQFNHLVKKFRKKKIDIDELAASLGKLRKLLGAAKVDAMIEECSRKAPRKKKAEELLDDD